MKKANFIFFIAAAALSVLVIIILATGFWKRFFEKEKEEYQPARIITPRETTISSSAENSVQMVWDENLNIKIPMNEGEVAVAVISRESEEGFAEEQFIAFLIPANTEKRVYVTYVNYDETERSYKRRWDAETLVTRAETLSFYDQDITGDRSNCIIAAGMNTAYEHTLTIFKRSGFNEEDEHLFNKIAELAIDGSIVIQETGRSLAYQQGITSGQSFNIATYGHDVYSENILDQIETIYSYSLLSGQYEQIRTSRIPGSQIEQQELRRILNGNSADFENFISDLWYYVSPQGTIDSRQYIYFNPAGREIIFYGDESQQVFNWLNSAATRYGLYITSQNISISTLRRRIDIELESLDSIRLRVTEDVRIRIEMIESWDGTYRRASSVQQKFSGSSISPLIDVVYDSSWGRIQFEKNGEYTIYSGNAARKGRYIFFEIDDEELLELRPFEDENRNERTIYRVESLANNALSLSRVRLGTSGVQDMFDPLVILLPVEN